MARSAEELKQLSVKEFTEAAKIYESGHAGIYEMCKDDYPQMLEELALEPFEDVLDVGRKASTPCSAPTVSITIRTPRGSSPRRPESCAPAGA